MTADLLGVLALLVFLLLLSGALAPLETLGWWAGWFGVAPEPQALVDKGRKPAAAKESAQHYLVFLPGIDSVSGESYRTNEVTFLERFRAALPATQVVELFPYSVTNRALTGQRAFARVWRWVLARKIAGRQLVGFMINVRNLWQVVVSADRRYGPMYDEGSAELVLAGLARSGYPLESGVPVTILGYSGGGQIAVGAASLVQSVLKAPLYIISLGGVMCADPGLRSVTHLYHFYGAHDYAQTLGKLAFPGRWPVFKNSAWNRAKAQGKLSFKLIGPMKHTGKGGYFDAAQHLPDGTSFLDATVAELAKVVREVEPDTPKTSAKADGSS